MDSLTIAIAAVAGLLLLLPRFIKLFRKPAPSQSPCGSGCGGCAIHERCGEGLPKGGAK